jgi:glutathione peroxidase
MEGVETNIYSFKAELIDGKLISLEEFKGKTLLIVNVASKCGFTPQYGGLETLYKTFKDDGFVVLGFPCNQFGNQEPGTEQEIKTFCDSNYHITFPLFKKIDVNGPDTHPLYAYLKTKKSGVFGTKGIKWNFTKFLVDRNGHPVKRFSPTTKPEALAKTIQGMLKNPSK